MMKRIFFTQRVEFIESYGERRDATDQRVSALLRTCGFLPIPVPNHAEMATELCRELQPQGIFISGGNNLQNYHGDAPERDETERVLLEYAMKEKLPVFGICRGLQFIADYFGSPLYPVSGHVRTRHRITGELQRDSVNSYHTLGAKELKPPLRCLARAEDGTVEALCHESLPILGIGWHPEREETFQKEDIDLLQKFYGME